MEMAADNVEGAGLKSLST